MTAAEVERAPAATRERLLDDAALPGLDVEGARRRVDSIEARRRTVVRSVLGVAAALLVVTAGTLLLLGEDDPDEIVADRSVTTTSTTAATTTTLPAAPTTSTSQPPPPSTVATTTVPPTTTTAPPPTTLPPNQPLQAQVQLSSPSVAAGSVAEIEVAWVDPDHAGAEPQISTDWGDPAVSALDTPAPAPRCDAPGTSSAGTQRREFRYATPGTHTVRVTLTTCGGVGPYAEVRTVEATVTVTEARIDGRPARTVVAVAPRTANGLPVLPSLDSALAVVTPDDPADPDVELPARDPVLAQFGTSGPATVLTVPIGLAGTLRLTWSGAPCESTAVLAEAPVGATPATVALESAC